MSRNLPFCCLAILVFLFALVRAATSGDCSSGGLFEAWRAGESAPVAAIDSRFWYRSSLGWIVAPEPCAAREAAVEMAAATEAFERHFTGEVPAGAVVDVEHGAHAQALKEAGAAWVLPWRFERKAAPDDRVASIREQVRAQLSAGGREPDPAQVEAIVAQAVSRLKQVETPEVPAAPTLEPRAMRHELAHRLFTEVVWPSTRDRFSQYGGDAPDWLDEAAAILAEDETMTRSRRERFGRLVASGATIPLDEYLAMPHPVFAGEEFQALIEQAREAAGPNGMAVVSGSLAPGADERAVAFYAQTRGFVDYLIERTNDPRALHEVARFMRAGGTFEQWLLRQDAARGLPRELAGLEQDFLRFSVDAR